MSAAPKPGIWVALLFIGAGAAMMIGMAVDQAGLNVPLWVAQAAAFAFVSAGVSILGQVISKPWLSRLGGLGVVYCLCVPGLWILLDPATKSCTATIAFFSQTAGDLTCRIAFGTGAVITAICAVLMTIGVMRASRREKN